jgi:lipopolysaccharide/colanic/teichoic acid biosynthesis glycosyltransferase
MLTQPAMTHAAALLGHGPPALLRSVKRCADLVLATLLLVLLAPVLLAVALAVRLSSRGPVLFVQRRVGQDLRARQGDGRLRPVERRRRVLGGRPFWIYKFRTMVADAERYTGPVWCSGASDLRVTRVGRFLRRSHLDELPQLVNVLRGEMSLVGPRPERPCFVESLIQEIPDYHLRLKVRPGITGLAQITRGPDRTLDDVRDKLRLDLRYIRCSALALEARILLRTVGKLRGG